MEVMDGAYSKRTPKAGTGSRPEHSNGKQVFICMRRTTARVKQNPVPQSNFWMGKKKKHSDKKMLETDHGQLLVLVLSFDFYVIFPYTFIPKLQGIKTSSVNS